ncbi:MAG: adenosylmethionine--8-amino-7-oxononanoate transaminase [Legionella sp.]|nr:adenosylmethionine--8-amino-7-oxononanoate transaminase [Legionella sp.]
MVNISALINSDLQHIWHPCTQMKDFEQCPPLVVHRAKGAYLYTDRGEIIDGLSSWWCKSLGHGHPAIIAAMKKQLDAFEHVIAANTTHPALVELGEKLAQLSKKDHVFFASDGSCAVEIALKLVLHANQIKGQPHRNEFIALTNGYHGETLGALSVSDTGRFKEPYEGYGVTCHFIDAAPYYVKSVKDSLWDDAEIAWQDTLVNLEKIKANVGGLILEPIIQGAGGMQCYSANFLKKLADWARANDIYLIADEIMTGMGRTGEWLASHHAKIEADLICLSKGLTAGAMPLSCVLIDKGIYQLFYDDYNKGKSFLHSHTHSGNSLAVSAALATINTIESEGINQQAAELGQLMHRIFNQIASETHQLNNVRSVGAMVAADLVELDNDRVGYRFYQEALKRGALLRPLGNTLYWLPPLNTPAHTIDKLAEITLNAINATYD